MKLIDVKLKSQLLLCILSYRCPDCFQHHLLKWWLWPVECRRGE